MTIQRKVLSLILVVFVVFCGMHYAVQRFLIMPSFVSLERDKALTSMDRVLGTIDRELEILDTKANDWGSWDDTYGFMQDRNAAFSRSNLRPDSLESLKIHVMYLFNTRRQPVWGLSYDFESRQELDMPDLVSQLAGSRLTAPNYLGQGLVLTSRGPLIIASRPILTSRGSGPARGAMVLGQFLDVAAIATQTRSDLSFTVLNLAWLEPDKAAILSEARRVGFDQTIIRKVGGLNRVYRVLPDLAGQPALLLQIDIPRVIYAKGATAVNFALAFLLIAGATVMAVLYCGLSLMVLNPLSRLTEHAVRIGLSNDFSGRIDFRRQDELGRLALEFNRMMEHLREARETLADQSYSSGLAEMARGVLHNIGNAITPLNVKMSSLRSELNQAPLAEIELASKEMDEPLTPSARRADLARFMELAALELAELVGKAGLSLEQMSKQLEHVQQALADQQRFSRAQRVIQAVDLAALVRDTVELLSDRFRRALSIELDASLNAVGEVSANRIAVQQVVSNLLINAAEAILAAGQPAGGGRMRISASHETVDGVPMAQLCFEDNGPGIAAEILPRIFESGFSTRRRGSGLGLHWSANTVASLNGRIYAQSRGTGQGAVFYLLLPIAQDKLSENEA